MTWRRVAVIYLVLLVLAGLVAFDLRPRAPEPGADPGAPERSLLGVDADALARIRFQRGATAVTAARAGDRWKVVEPEGVAVGADLIAAAVATLTAGQPSERMTEGGDIAAFGLAQPIAEVEVTLRDAASPIRVLLGANNPTNTALYAQRAGDPAVYLVGLNVRYYLDLIFDAATRPTAAARTNVAA